MTGKDLEELIGSAHLSRRFPKPRLLQRKSVAVKRNIKWIF